ncbi:MAG: hypothetical protein WB973_10810, partial [Thermoanaerobaculia bacterium]
MGANTLTDRYVAQDFYIVFGGSKSLTTSSSKLPSTLLHLLDSEIAQFRRYLADTDLFDLLKKLKNPKDTTARLKPLAKFRDRIGAWTSEWRDRKPDRKHTSDEILISFLYTWYPLLARPSTDPIHLVVVSPFPRGRPPHRVSTIFTLFGYAALPALTAKDLLELSQRTENAFSHVISRLTAIDREVLSRKAPDVTLTVERAIRSLQHLSKASVEEEDRWDAWRKYFPRKDWDVALWGASQEMVDLFTQLKN